MLQKSDINLYIWLNSSKDLFNQASVHFTQVVGGGYETC